MHNNSNDHERYVNKAPLIENPKCEIDDERDREIQRYDYLYDVLYLIHNSQTHR